MLMPMPVEGTNFETSIYVKIKHCPVIDSSVLVTHFELETA